MIEIAEKEGCLLSGKSIRTYHDLSKATSIKFAEGVELSNRRMAYMERKAREARARNKAFMRKLIEEVTNVRQ